MTTSTDTLTARTITNTQIQMLRTEAKSHGDLDMVDSCDRALRRRGGRGECAAAINSARNMDEETREMILAD